MILFEIIYMQTDIKTNGSNLFVSYRAYITLFQFHKSYIV